MLTRGSTGPAALAGVQVQAYKDAPWSGVFRVEASTVTGGDGRYSLRLATAGAYQIAFTPDPASGYVPTWWGGKTNYTCGPTSCSGLFGDVLDVRADRSDVNAEVVRGVSVRGRVTAVGTGAGLSGVNLQVYATRTLTPCPPCRATAGTARTDSTGSYAVSLPADTYSFHFVPPLTYGSGWCCTKFTTETADKLVVSADRDGVDVALPLAIAFAGTVTDAVSGAGVTGVTVIAYRVGSTSSHSMGVDAAGRFSTAIGPGEYHVFFSAPSTHVSEWWSDRPDRTTADVVIVSSSTDSTKLGVKLARK